MADADTLIAMLPRMAAMNSFVRSDAARRRGLGSGPLAYIFYHYKREALKRATRLGIATHRKCSAVATCNHCGGSGRYTDWNGQEHDHCWRCTNSGQVTLSFLESELPGGVTWLTPERHTWGIADLRDVPPSSNRPEVNQPGVDLEPSQVAEHMNEIEAFFTERPPKHSTWTGDWDYFATYTIWVGRTQPGQCYLCKAGMERIYGGHVVRTGRVTWNGLVCKTCDDELGDKTFTTLSPMIPREFLTPQIERWIELHPVRPEPEHRFTKVVTSYPATQRNDDEEIPF